MPFYKFDLLKQRWLQNKISLSRANPGPMKRHLSVLTPSLRMSETHLAPLFLTMTWYLALYSTIDSSAGFRRFLTEDQHFYKEDFENFVGFINVVEGYITGGLDQPEKP